MVSKQIDQVSGDDCSSIAQQGDAAVLEGNTLEIDDTTAPTVLIYIERRWWHGEEEEVLLLIVNVVVLLLGNAMWKHGIESRCHVPRKEYTHDVVLLHTG